MSKSAAFLVALAVLITGCDQFRGGGRQLDRAESFLQKGDYSAAAITLRTLVSKDAANSPAQMLLAKVQRLQGDTGAATAALDAAAGSGADPLQVAALRAEILLDQGKYPDLLKVSSLTASLPAPQQQRMRARALLGMRRPLEALTIVDGLLQAESAAPDLLLLAAQCHAMLGRLMLAKEYVDKALDGDPRSPRGWLLRSALLETTNTAGSISALKKAVEFAPGELTVGEQVSLMLRIASVALSAGDLPAAKAAHGTLLALVPQSSLALIVGAQVELMEGHTAEAVAGLQRLVQQVPDLSQGRAALVGALLANGGYELALHELSLGFGAQIDPKRIEALRSRIQEAAAAKAGSEEQVLKAAAAAAALEQPIAARQILSQGLKTRPESIPLALALQQTLLSSGQVKSALNQAQTLVQRFPEPAVILALAEAQVAQGDHAGAAASYERVWRKQPSGAIAVALSQARVRAGAADPLTPLTQWLNDHPQDILARMALAAAAQQLGQTAKAVTEYERVLAQQPQNAVALNNLAGLYQQQHDSRALPVAKRAYELASKSPSVADTYGWILAEAGDIQAAIQILRGASEAMPAAPEMRYHLGAALAQGGTAQGRLEAKALLTDLLRDGRPFAWRADAEKLLVSLSGSV
jgi:tetratricopeptide (TPR) repeat protein